MSKLGVPAESAKHIASFLTGYGLITEEQYSHSVTASKEGDKGLIDVIIDFGFTDEVSIAKAISESYDIEFIDLNSEQLPELSPTTFLPLKFITENRVLPIKCEGNDLTVAIAEPTILNLISSIRLLTNKTIHTNIATFTQISDKISKISGDKTSSDKYHNNNKVNKRNTDSTSKDEDVAKSSEVIGFVDKTLKKAIKLGASDIHIETYKKSARLRLRLDGVLIEQQKDSKFIFKHYPAIVTRIKIMSKLDIAERRLPQDGAISFNDNGKEVDFRVSVLPASHGERVVMRILDTSSISLTIGTLGFQDQDEKAFKDAVDAPQGMVLVTGPTGSGKSTTLYAALARINKPDINILTAEDPVEFSIEGVGQVHVREDIGLTFSSTLRSFLRQDPEVVMVGEIRDKETVDIAIKAALTGHLVLSTLHTNDSTSTITRMINMGVEPYLLTSSLTLVIAQRLARKICENCKTIDEDNGHNQLLSIGFTPEESSRIALYKGKGCNKCNNTGYKGRKGIYEVLRVTENIKEGVLKGLTAPELLKIAKNKDGFSTMQEVGRGLLVQGDISIEEYQRVLMIE